MIGMENGSQEGLFRLGAYFLLAAIIYAEKSATKEGQINDYSTSKFG